MSHPSVRYEPVSNPSGGTIDKIDDEDPGDDLDHEVSELEPLAPNGGAEFTEPSSSSPTQRSFIGALFSAPHVSRDRLSPVPSPVPFAPTTPRSSDGVFMNIPAKPTSSRDRNDDDELGEDEWIFMSSERRKKLAPPKYSRIKRDRAPRYTTEYTPPALPASTGTRKSKRVLTLNPRINSLPAGSSPIFLATSLLSTLLPFFGFLIIYAVCRGRWTSHATRLGCWTGLGLGLFHVGLMMFYIPALLPSVFAASSAPLISFLLWTAFVGLPMGWRLSLDAAREFMWVKTEERVLRANLGVAAASSATTGDEDEDVEGGYRYIEGTDIRVRDLRKILARARDARLARSLRAAGF